MRPGYKQTEVGEIPEEWRVSRFEDLCCVLRGGSPRPIQNYITDSADGINWIKIGDVGVGAKYLDTTAEKIIAAGALRSRYVKAGDFLLSNSMSFGRPYILRTEGCVHDGWLVIQDYQDRFNTEYLYYCLSSEAVLAQYTRYAAGSGVLNLNKEVVSGISVAVPPLPEQRAIAEALSEVDGLLGALEALIAKKRAIKRAALQQLLTGKTRLPGFSGEWKATRLGEVVERFIGGGTPSRANRTYWGSEIPWMTVKDFATFAPRSTQECITQSGLANSASHLIPAGTLITAARMALGRAVIYEVDVAINQDLKALILKPQVDVHFLRYWFELFGGLIDDIGGGSTVRGVSVGELSRLAFLGPSKPEQTAIATVLSDMDAEIAALEARRDKTRAIKQGMMQQLLTGRVRLVKPEGATDA